MPSLCHQQSGTVSVVLRDFHPDREVVGVSVLVNAFAHASKKPGYVVGARAHAVEDEDLHGVRLDGDGCILNGHVLVDQELVENVPFGTPAGGHIKFHSRGTVWALITFRCCRVLKAWVTNEVLKGSSLKSPIARIGVSGPCTSRTRS